MTTDPYARRIKHIMSKVVVSGDPDDTLEDAVGLMQDNRISVLPVTDQRDRCVGILSATDLIDLSRQPGTALGEQKVADRMTGAVASLGPEASLATAAKEMVRHRVHHLPVVDNQQRLLGIISTMDILDAFVEGAGAD